MTLHCCQFPVKTAHAFSLSASFVAASDVSVWCSWQDLPSFPSSHKSHSQWWRMEEPKHSSTFPPRPPTENDKSKWKPAGDGGGSCKRVTMATASRYLGDRRYLVRRPLVSSTPTSILKKTETEEVRRTSISSNMIFTSESCLSCQSIRQNFLEWQMDKKRRLKQWVN